MPVLIHVFGSAFLDHYVPYAFFLFVILCFFFVVRRMRRILKEKIEEPVKVKGFYEKIPWDDFEYSHAG